MWLQGARADPDRLDDDEREKRNHCLFAKDRLYSLNDCCPDSELGFEFSNAFAAGDTINARTSENMMNKYTLQAATVRCDLLYKCCYTSVFRPTYAVGGLEKLPLEMRDGKICLVASTSSSSTTPGAPQLERVRAVDLLCPIVSSSSKTASRRAPSCFAAADARREANERMILEDAGAANLPSSSKDNSTLLSLNNNLNNMIPVLENERTTYAHRQKAGGPLMKNEVSLPELHDIIINRKNPTEKEDQAQEFQDFTKEEVLEQIYCENYVELATKLQQVNKGASSAGLTSVDDINIKMKDEEEQEAATTAATTLQLETKTLHLPFDNWAPENRFHAMVNARPATHHCPIYKPRCFCCAGVLENGKDNWNRGTNDGWKYQLSSMIFEFEK